MKIAALYIRVSTDKQEELSPDAQRRLLSDFAKKNNYIIDNEYIFIESGISGKYAEKRPEFQKMIGMAKSKNHLFDVILVWKYSRFARNQEESIVYKSLLKKNGIEVISISEPLIDGPFGTLIERIIEWMDEYYSIRLSGEVKRGMTENALRGNMQTRPPFGYILENDKLIIDKENKEFVRLIFERYVYNSKSFYGIAKELNALKITTKNGNPFTSRAIKYILGNPIYMGNIMWGLPLEQRSKRTRIDTEGVIIRKGSHEPIISEELFNLAKDRLTREYKYKALPPESQIHWLSSMLRCSSCGRTLVSNGGKTPSFQCSGYKKHQCNVSHYVRAAQIEQAVLDSLLDATKNKNFEYSNLIIEDKSFEIKVLNDTLKKCIKKEERIKEAYRNGIDTLDEYKQNKLIIMKEKEEIQSKIDNLKKDFSVTDNAEMHRRIENVYKIVSSELSSRNEKNKAIKSIITDIVFDKQNKRIEVSYFLS
ncbi:recombinase family protein [Anaerosacchariphilus polymeriproducens]|uniref:Recombinase family protein n=1 Tax=Anaerosacchariphilus polymeriproducens TaxID=1812858 RepID=A0A371ARI2_9FIRM|nr:recombinase family protein [Anaerosacchariphilus polymeriproducens]RDU22179.1 recombinase family protein [Anaerosacchariphilus polymeriproducens]